MIVSVMATPGKTTSHHGGRNVRQHAAQHVAPARGRRRDRPRGSSGRLGEDRRAEVEAEDDQQRRHALRRDVLRHDPQRAAPSARAASM